MAQTPALLSSDFGQLRPLIEELKTQNKKKSDTSEPRLKRTPAVQERVRTNDTLVTMVAKIYVLTKREHDNTKSYRKEHLSLIKVTNKRMIETIKKTSDNIRKAIEKNYKLDKEALEESIKQKEANKLFEEERDLEKQKEENARHKELLDAINGKKKKKEEDKKEKSWLDKFVSLLSKSILLMGKSLFRMLPGSLQGLVKGIGVLGKLFYYGMRALAPALGRVITTVLANPIAALTAAIAALSVGSFLNELGRAKKNDESRQSAAERGDIEGIKKAYKESAKIFQSGEPGAQTPEPTEEELNKYAENELKRAKTPQAEAALKRLQAERAENKRLDELFEDYMDKSGYTRKNKDSEFKNREGASAPKSLLDKAKKYTESQRKPIEQVNKSGPISSSEYRELVGKTEGGPMGYDSMYGTFKEQDVQKYMAEETGGKRLTQMTIDEAAVVQDKRRKSNRNAMGRYQFMDVRSAARLAGLKGTDLMSPENQDKMFEAYTEANAKRLKKLGVEVTARTLRLAHSVGADNVPLLLKAEKENPNALPADVIGLKEGAQRDTNPHLSKKGVTVASYLATIDKKVSGMPSGTPSGVTYGSDTQLASSDDYKDLDAAYNEMSSMKFGEGTVQGETSAEPEKKLGIFSTIASGLKEQLNLLEEFKQGGGAKELGEVLQSLEASVTSRTSGLKPAIDEQIALGTTGKEAVNIITDARQTIVNKGSEAAVQVAKADVRTDLPIMEKVLYGYHS